MVDTVHSPPDDRRAWRNVMVLVAAQAVLGSQMPMMFVVGGLAGACAAYFRHIWGDAPRIIVVEPEVAPALYASVKAGSAQVTEGPESAMGRLDCKEPSLIALKGLARDADDFMLLSEDEGAAGSAVCADAGYPTTPSGAAGFSGLLAAGTALGLTNDSRVLIILSEQAS